MRFSLICATLRRNEEFARLLESLAEQTHGDFELVVVDQNSDDRLLPIIESYSNQLNINRIRVRPKGASAARNAGIEVAKGDLIGFPDDDCWYARNHLDKVATFFDSHPQWDGLSSLCVDENGAVSVGMPSKRSGPVTRYNVWVRIMAATLFLRRQVVERTGSFREDLGPGAATPWVGSEEMDYVLRALGLGFKIHYEPTAAVFHPAKETSYDRATRDRVYGYSLAMGRVMAIHKHPSPVVLWWLFRALAGATISMATLNPAKARFHMRAFQGRLQGWLSGGLDGAEEASSR